MTPRLGLLAVVLLSLAMSATGACSTPETPRPGPAGPTFFETIDPLVREKCQPCHQTGGIAPFPLVTYEQVSALASDVKAAVTQRSMPPWAALDQPDCVMTRKLAGDLSLTSAQIDAFARWVDGGKARGVTSTTSAVVAKSRVGLADKTHTFPIASGFQVPAAQSDVYRCFPIDPGFGDDTWIAESIVVPQDARVVHHALVYIDEAHQGVANAKGEDSYPCFGGPELDKEVLLLAWSPGGVPTVYGKDAAILVPKKAHLVVQVHYHPIADDAPGHVDVEVKALAHSPGHTALFALIGNAQSATDDFVRLLPGPDDPPSGPTFFIPANAKAHTESMELVVPSIVNENRVSVVGAHMHWAGAGMTIRVDRAHPAADEPASECLLSAPKYDFEWQRTYAYDAPTDELPIVRTGDKMQITCTYDNTTDNPHVMRLLAEEHLGAPVPIRLGSRTQDEMCQAMIAFVH